MGFNLFVTSVLSMDELEDHDKASKGKYTIGLGQDILAFCTDWEDVISMSMTVVQSLFEKYEIAPDRIGRLDVGSETIVDKSKAIKTWLMKLFEESGNADIEGVDSTNACYGGTAALFNCVDWVESTAWDGRFALVVATDSAVYAEGPARPSGGAGAVAMLIGPDAPLVIDRRCSATHMEHAYDFYKPNLASEYPVVDGHLSQKCYLMALSSCYRRFCTKFQKIQGRQFSLMEADFLVFHSPYNKLVQKSFARLVFEDFSRNKSFVDEAVAETFHHFSKLSLEESYTNRDLEKASQQVAKSQYNEKVIPGTLIPKQIGNTYTVSLYAGLASLIHNKADSLVGKRILMFSYGSGLASSMFTVCAEQGLHPFNLSGIQEKLDLSARLASRTMVSPEEFGITMSLMETRYGAKSFTPESEYKVLQPGTFYLTEVDDLYRRSYARVPPSVPKLCEKSKSNGFVH
ncbi:hypothetical protein O6H91_Y123600 [Diphasiastrum complanatum]|nr:hypothetical protein O6H91_Y123600 [Diphasiastrum complanatum]